MSVAFVLCVEAGNLENQAGLLVRSIRRWGGGYSQSRIVAYRPRVGPPLRRETIDLFDAHAVDLDETVRNRDLHHYPIGNKVFAAAAAEHDLDDDVVVFLDSDTVILGEPSDLDLSGGAAIALRPVDRKGRGSEGPHDPADAYWTRLYDLCGVQDDRFVTTTVDGLSVRAYWNAGLIAARRDAGIFGRWLRDLCTLARAGHLPGGKMTNLDQVALSTATADVDDITVLDHRYNYPLPLRARLPEPMRTLGIDQLVHVHYHQWFNRSGYLSLVRPPLDRTSARYEWLSAALPFEPLIHDRPITRQRRFTRGLRRLWARPSP